MKITATHKRLLKNAIEAIDVLHADTSVGKATTIASLREIHEHAELLKELEEEEIQIGEDGKQR